MADHIDWEDHARDLPVAVLDRETALDELAPGDDVRTPLVLLLTSGGGGALAAGGTADELRALTRRITRVIPSDGPVPHLLQDTTVSCASGRATGDRRCAVRFAPIRDAATARTARPDAADAGGAAGWFRVIDAGHRGGRRETTVVITESERVEIIRALGGTP